MTLALAAALFAAAQAGDAAELNSRLLVAKSATAVLEQWCGEKKLAAPARVRAVRDMRANRRLSVTERRRMGLGMRETVRYRRVRLMCGDALMSEAENWYVPGRLTPAINRQLTGSDTPFGTAIRSLGPSRKTLGVEWLGGTDLFRHRALVLDRRGRVLAEVVETYKAEALGK